MYWEGRGNWSIRLLAILVHLGQRRFLSISLLRIHTHMYTPLHTHTHTQVHTHKCMHTGTHMHSHMHEHSRKQFGENYAQIPKMIVYKCLFSSKVACDIEKNTWHWYGSWFIDTYLRLFCYIVHISAFV